MKVKTFGMAAAIAAALAIGALPAAAAIGDGQLGGPPGFVADNTICAGGAAVTGVTGFTRTPGGNTVVAVATVQCAGGGPASTMGSMTGDPSELPGLTSCLPGQVAVGITGREGDFVDQLLLRCRNADGSGPITTSVPVFGGFGGAPDGPYDCPAGEVLTGLTGQSAFAGTTIRYVEIVCVPAPPACPPQEDDDKDGLNNETELLLGLLVNTADSDNDGIVDGNDDANGNGEDDEDEDDDDECPDPDEDDDGTDDEDEDDD